MIMASRFALSDTQKWIVESIRGGARLVCLFRRPVQYDDSAVDQVPDETENQLNHFGDHRAWCGFRLEIDGREKVVQRNTFELLRDLRVVELDRLEDGRAYYRLAGEWERAS